MAKSDHLQYPTLPGSVHQSDARLFHRALKERWPMSEETRARWMERMNEIIEKGDNREAVAALKVAATMDGLNQRDEISADVLSAVGTGERERILKPWEIAHVIASSVVGEYSTKEVNHNSNEQAPASCSPLVSLPLSPTGAGEQTG